MKPPIDPIIEEIHKARREIARRFGGDVQRISEEAKRRQALEGRPIWEPELATKSMQPISGGADSEQGSPAPAAE